MICKQDNKYKIKFNALFYDKEAINQGIKDFSDFIEASFENDILIIILKQENELIPYEFCNYVLALQNDKEL